MFARCLLGCRDTARQRPVPGGSRSRGLLHGPAGSSIRRHQEVLSNTLSSGLLISGYISPVAGLYGNRAAISLTAATNGHLGLVIQPVTGTAIRRVHDRCITGPRQVHDRLCWIQSQRAAGTPPPPWQPRREGAGRSGSLPRPQVPAGPAGKGASRSAWEATSPSPGCRRAAAGRWPSQTRAIQAAGRSRTPPAAGGRPRRRASGPDCPAGGGRPGHLVGDLPAMAAGRAAGPPHHRSAHRVPGARPVGDGKRRRGQLCRGQRRSYGGHRGRHRRGNIPGRDRAPGPAGGPSRHRAAPGLLAAFRRRPASRSAAQPVARLQ